MLIDLVSRVSGEAAADILGGGRRRPLPACRWLVARELMRRGYSETSAARMTNLTHATVRHGRLMLDIMSQHPRAGYAEEIRIEREFQRIIDTDGPHDAGSGGDRVEREVTVR